ncbi:MAG: multiple sugar transport system substrate-binding protein [Parcubacteria group bacterium Gr01-1014_66]|nr:MAG: multiple sugar transport system substrate-binding protein [Parcubacteria group bacterium Gr01-1014_66]
MGKNRLVIFGASALLICAGIILFISFGRSPAALRSATLHLLIPAGMHEDAWRKTAAQYHDRISHITLMIEAVDPRVYESTLLDRLAAGTGPDLFLLKNTWIKAHGTKVMPMPAALSSSLPVKEFNRLFVDIASQDLITKQEELLGIPLSIDTLALFYNKDFFNAAGIAVVPTTWESIIASIPKLTRISENREIERSTIATGSGKNTHHALEIMSVLLMQNGVNILNENGGVALEQGADHALSFYTSFADRSSSRYTWDERFGDSLDAFADGKSAMAFGFLEDVADLRARNPHLNLGVAPFPQPETHDNAVTFGNYFFPVVAKQSPYTPEAWDFLLFLASREGAEMWNEAAGTAPARRDLIQTGAETQEKDIFFTQTLIARNWAIPHEATVRTLFNEAADAIITHQSTAEHARERLRQRLGALIP